MDSLTQIVVGIATAEACLGKQLKNRTFIYGAIFATIPDLDVFVGKLFDPITAISIHRSFSHSIIFYLIASLFFGAILYVIEQGKVKIFQAINACFFIFLTHSLLDAFTTWGTQIFWPLPYRVAIKSIFVVDIFYTIPWIICLVMVYKNKQTRMRIKWLKIGFYISSLYLLLGVFTKLYVTNKFETVLKQQNIEYSDIIVKPTFSNIILWNANIMSNNVFLLSDYSLFDKKTPVFKSYNRNLELANQYKNAPIFKKLEHVSEGWYTIQQKNDSLIFNDLRFGLLKDDPINPQFAFSYVLENKNGRIQATEVPKEKRKGKEFLYKIFTRIFQKND
jgi:inner membrane protein